MSGRTYLVWRRSHVGLALAGMVFVEGRLYVTVVHRLIETEDVLRYVLWARQQVRYA